VTHDLASRLVIENHSRRLFRICSCNGTTIHTHRIISTHALTDVSRLTIDRDATSDDQLFHLAARADASIGKHFMKFRHQNITVQILIQALLNAVRFSQI
jgi:hypothetical protein